MCMKKKLCSHCGTLITAPNLERHEASCSGLGTWRTKELARKSQKSTTYPCVKCNKVFKSSSALNGHTARSHTYREQQRGRAIKGITKQKEMGIWGKGYPHTEATKQKLSAIACARLVKHSKYSKNIAYRDGIILESTYELRVAEILDELGIEWQKVRRGFIWNDDGRVRRYIPDFYLPAYDLYLDPKNDYLVKKDERKIKSAMAINNIRVLVITNDQINKEFLRQLSVEQVAL